MTRHAKSASWSMERRDKGIRRHPQAIATRILMTALSHKIPLGAEGYRDAPRVSGARDFGREGEPSRPRFRR